MSVISSRRRPSVRRLLLGHPLRVLWDSSLRESARHPSAGWLPCTNDREVTPNSVSLVAPLSVRVEAGLARSSTTVSWVGRLAGQVSCVPLLARGRSKVGAPLATMPRRPWYSARQGRAPAAASLRGLRLHASLFSAAPLAGRNRARAARLSEPFVGPPCRVWPMRIFRVRQIRKVVPLRD